jgi:protein-L-isoaspartate(D-aspartate) O-methyltransferase
MSPSAVTLQRELVAHLRATHALTDPAVAEAFLAVPRHRFLPGLPLEQVYADEAIPTKHADGHPISSSSQPAIMAIMLEQLDVSPGQRILEIGAGTGYNAALLGRLVGPSGQVISLDLDEDIVLAARKHLAAAGARNVAVVQGDGAYGHRPGAPYDRIILSVGAWEIAPAWHEQLAPGGRLVLPLELGQGPQKSLALEKPASANGDLWFESVSVRDCGFMRLRGALAGPEQLLALGPEPGLLISFPGPPPAPPDDIYAWLNAGGTATASAVRVSGRELWGGVGLWLGLQARNVCTLTASDGPAQRGLIPCLFGFGGQPVACLSVGLLGSQGLSLLSRGPDSPADGEDDDGREALALHVHGYGPQGPLQAEELLDLLSAWNLAGRPGTAGLQVRVLPRHAPYQPAPREIIVPKRFSQLVIAWPPVWV